MDGGLGNGGVNAGNEVIVIGAGIVVINAAGGGGLVAGAAARVEVEDHEIVGGEVVEHVIEGHAVHGERAPVNFEDERILFRGIEIGRLDHPALHFGVAAGGEVDLFGFGEALAGEEARVDVGQPGDFSGSVQVVAHDVWRVLRVGHGADGDQVAGSGVESQHGDAGGDGLDGGARAGGVLAVAGAGI